VNDNVCYCLILSDINFDLSLILCTSWPNNYFKRCHEWCIW